MKCFLCSDYPVNPVNICPFFGTKKSNKMGNEIAWQFVCGLINYNINDNICERGEL